MPVVPTLWVAADDPEASEGLRRGGVPADLASLLARRGACNVEDARDFLQPRVSHLLPPTLLRGVDEAVTRLVAAKEGNERVVIVGDYDVDGVTGTALLEATFRAVGIETTSILPHRLKDGYGLQETHVERASARGARVIVTVDCGTTARAPIQSALSRGIDVIVADHHLPGAEFPKQAVQINPKQPECSYPFDELCGAGLALKLATALLERLGRDVPLAPFLRMAALGTIADQVPLRGENRVIASLGLQALPASSGAGLKSLIEKSAIKPPFTADDIGFRLAPRINAAGRLGSAEDALELLLTRDESRAELLASQLDDANRERQQYEQKVTDEARSMVFERCESLGEVPGLLAAWSDEWHKGVVGIAAGRLAREFHRPTVLLAVDSTQANATGSGRSLAGIHLYDFLNRWSGRMQRFGGHEMAIGLTVSIDELETLRAEWEREAAWPEELLVRRYEYEVDLENAGDFDVRLFRRLLRLGPYGNGNQAPLIRLSGLRATMVRPFGKGHLKVLAQDQSDGRVSLVGWRWEDRRDVFEGVFDVLGMAGWDDYMGSPTLTLVDARAAGAGASDHHPDAEAMGNSPTGARRAE